MKFLALLLFLGWWPYAIQAKGFTLFEHENYGGRYFSPPVGAECVNLASFNDLTTSIKFDWSSVPTVTKLSFYNDPDCNGAEWSALPGNADITRFSDEWNDKWSSFRYDIGLVAFSLFEHKNYGGRYFSPRYLFDGVCVNQDDFNDLSSSMKLDWGRIPPDTKLSFFNDPDCKGAAWVATTGHPDIFQFSPEWNDQWSSFRWKIGEGRLMGFALFEHENYGGRYFSPPFPLDGRCMNLIGFDDLTTSIKFDWGSVPNANKLSFFNGGDCTGAEWIALPGNADIARFSDEWNNQWSSFRFQSWPTFLVVAHMVNTRRAVDWALAKGANAVEIDLQFAEDEPLEFRHGGICDCSCNAGGVCGVLDGCDSRTSFKDMILHLADKSMVALVYIDTKVKSIKDKARAGSNLFSGVKMMYDRGWNGRILLNGAKPDYMDFLASFATRAAASGLKDSIYYTFDDSPTAPSELLDKLRTITTNAVYSWGISACLLDPLPLEGNLRTAKSLNFRVVGVWTIDEEKSMNKHIDNGVGAILTNHPGRLYTVAVERGLLYPQNRLGLWDQTPPKCDSAEVTCDFDLSGCRISLPALPGCLTKCRVVRVSPTRYMCEAKSVQCKAEDSPWCFSSTGRSSFSACQAGGGNCQGYPEHCANKGADCDYHPGGCSISRPAVPGCLTRCKYLGFWTCGGEAMECKAADSPWCFSSTERSSRAACQAGGGDCGGYPPPPCVSAGADCDYHRGGCTISRAASPGCLTKCQYKGFWTCGGAAVECKAKDSPWCFSQTGRSSLAACQAGGGDCGGY